MVLVYFIRVFFVWDLHGRCLFDLKHQEAYDLAKF